MANPGRVRELVERQAEAHSWALTAEGCEQICRQVLAVAARLAADQRPGAAPKDPDDAALVQLIWAIYADRPVVLAALDPGHADHDRAWTTIHGYIAAWLRRHRYFPTDDVWLNEYSPDICALERVRAHLAGFSYASRLETYVQRITERAAKQWLRSHATRKRGGAGIRSALARRASPEQARTWGHCYLSQRVGADQELAWDEVIPAAQHEIVHLAEGAALLREIERSVREMRRDPCYNLLVDVWRDLLLGEPNVTALARQRGIPPKTMFNVKDRLTRRLMPLMERWARDA